MKAILAYIMKSLPIGTIMGIIMDIINGKSVKDVATAENSLKIAVEIIRSEAIRDLAKKSPHTLLVSIDLLQAALDELDIVVDDELARRKANDQAVS